MFSLSFFFLTSKASCLKLSLFLILRWKKLWSGWLSVFRWRTNFFKPINSSRKSKEAKRNGNTKARKQKVVGRRWHGINNCRRLEQVDKLAAAAVETNSESPVSTVPTVSPSVQQKLATKAAAVMSNEEKCRWRFQEQKQGEKRWCWGQSRLEAKSFRKLERLDGRGGGKLFFSILRKNVSRIDGT